MARRKKKSSSSSSSPSAASSTSTTTEEQSIVNKIKTSLQTAVDNFKARPLHIRVTAIALVLGAVILFWSNLHSTTPSIDHGAWQSSAWRHHFSLRSRQDNFVTLVPGELPAYTGWARPATTLARHFFLDATSLDKFENTAVAGEAFEFTIVCHTQPACGTEGGALFFVRAYGPSVITGLVHDKKDGSYQVELLPKDPGPYTVEVVLTFSNPPSFGQFPLPPDQPEPAYEGYLLPQFPLPLQVIHSDENPAVSSLQTSPSKESLPVCTFEELYETDPNSAWEKARWVVTDKMNDPHHVDNVHYTKEVTFDGYEQSPNGLGIQMEYHHDDCRILPQVAPQHPQNPLNQCTTTAGSPLHFLFIGDSNMRLQRNLFEIAFLGLPEDQREKSRYHTEIGGQVRASYHDLTGGALKANVVGGDRNVTRFFQTILARQDTTLGERYIVIFNTGMHDIHRLCSHEFADDRKTYLGDDIGTDATQGFHCVMHYRYALEGLAADVMNFAQADLTIFQSTTAGWPKYGNYGVVWPTEGVQNMPVATEFIDFFNNIAYDVMKESFPAIPIMDGYWISYARPDNRQMNKGRKKALEMKLSHPGYEVVMAMLQTLTTIVTQSELCQ